LRLDGFVSLDADGKGGYLQTKPFKISGKQLILNASCQENGSASVEIIDESGELIAGSQPVKGDSVSLPVSWKKGISLNSFVNRTVRLKIHLKNASLYAFWME